MKISFDPNYRNLMEHGYEPILRNMAGLADLIKVSDEDLHMLLQGHARSGRARENPRDEPASHGARHARFGAKRRSTPATQQYSARPPSVEVADTVGAGDASIGGLLYSLMARHGDWPDHLKFALAAGAAACRHSGAHSPSLEEVEELL